MGGGSWSSNDWKAYTRSNNYDTKSTDQIFSSRDLDSSLDPKGVKRESRDSADKGPSTAIILALDVTGSMGMLADAMAREGLNTLCTEIYTRKPVSDPHILCAAIGDAEMGDRAPLQVTQFEADIRIAKQLEKLYLEKGGGGNHYESYALAWWFAAKQTSTDCFEKRGKKGYLFTLGDEQPTPYLRREDLLRVCGEAPEQDRISNDELLTLVSRQWEVFHLIVEEGAEGRKIETRDKWTSLLGQRAIFLSDHKKMAEVIVSIIQMLEGTSHDDVVKSWDGSTSLVVAKATKELAASKSAGGVVTL